MKNIFKTCLDNTLFIILLIPIFISGYCIIFAFPILILKSLNFDILGADCVLMIFTLTSWFIILKKITDRYIDKKGDEMVIFSCLVGVFFISFCVFNDYINSSKKELSSRAPAVSHETRREYSSNYSSYDSRQNLNYSYSDSPSYTPPARMPDNENISYSTSPKIEEIIKMGAFIVQQRKTEHNNQNIFELIEENIAEVDILTEDKEIPTHSPEIGIYDGWEYVTSDEYGNDYYISKHFGAYTNTTTFEGTIIHAEFKKVLSSGREVEMPEYDINKGIMTTKKEILTYEESIVRFRNENGFKEIFFSTLSGYTADNSIIIGYGVNNSSNLNKWIPINDTIYEALYKAAYKQLRIY